MWSALEIPSERAAIEYEDRQQIMALHGAAPPEAVGAFLEKRPAEFADSTACVRSSSSSPSRFPSSPPPGRRGAKTTPCPTFRVLHDNPRAG